MTDNNHLNPFLKQVAAHYLKEPALEQLCFILPNRRSILFLQHYFKTLWGKPLLSPQMLTINDFLYKVAGAHPTDRVTLLLRLYDCYRTLNPQAEPLDEFIFWGDVLLGDFSDVDKYYCNARALFTNVSDFKNLSGGFEDLDERQREALERFMGNFRLKTSGKQHDARDKFRQIWDLLGPLYAAFNEKLDAEGLSYEGKVYRRARDLFAENAAVDILEEVFPQQKKFVFTGLNMLSECERYLLSQMAKHPGLAEFCWDFPGEWIANPFNKSSFMKRNIEAFPPAFPLEKVAGTPHIHILPVASAVGQTRQIPAILKKSGLLPKSEPTAVEPDSEKKRLPLESLALILPDENLLLPVLNAIPQEMGEINVTMGSPMLQSSFYSFFQQLIELQLHVRAGEAGPRFYHKPVWALFASPVFKLFCDDTPGGKQLSEIVRLVKSQTQYYIPQESLGGHPLLEALFRSVLTDEKADDPAQIRSFAAYLKDCIQLVGPAFSRNGEMAFEAGFAKTAYQAVNQLSELNLAIRPATFSRLLSGLISGQSIPFEGEPLGGLQVMGPLESRCLDFERLIVFSCNEGVFPRKSVSASFIPPELRTGFGLPTSEHQDAMWAYYFYRMIARAREVWLLSDSRTEGLKKGEESRFIKQLRYHLKAQMSEWSETLPPSSQPVENESVQKTPEMLEKIQRLEFSPSSFEMLAACTMKFYYRHVVGLKPPKEVNEFLDGGLMGDVFHSTMEALYHSEARMKTDEDPDKRKTERKTPGMPKVTREYLEGWLKRKDEIRWKVDSLIRHKLKAPRVAGRNLVMAEVIVKYVLNVLQADIAYLKESGAAHFNILELERNVRMNYLDVKFMGYIDRLDCLDGGPVRVVDYKTGSDDPKCLGLKADSVETVFNNYQRKAAIQFHIYDEAVCQEESLKQKIATDGLVNTMYVPYSLNAKTPVADYWADDGFKAALSGRLKDLLDQLRDPQIPFAMTEKRKSCEYCDFKTLCGR